MIHPTLTIRISDEQLLAIRELAKKNDVSVGQLTRWAIDALLRQVKRNEGHLVLPLDFDEKKGK